MFAFTLAVAIATPAVVQSTVVMPLPGANGYAVAPPRQGFTTQVLPMPGGGWMIVPPGAQGSRHNRASRPCALGRPHHPLPAPYCPPQAGQWCVSPWTKVQLSLGLLLPRC